MHLPARKWVRDQPVIDGRCAVAYAILRTKKLKSVGALARSARHSFREQPTPNADPGATARNRTVGARGADQVLAAFERGLPERRRRDAVIGIEYLITASPEAFRRHGGTLDDAGDGYFADALRWLRRRHGAENVISATVHLDESTPHLVAYVVPKTADGRLSCRDFLGGPAKLRAMQDDFHAACGAKRGLERGVTGSRARHEDIKSIYGAMVAQDEAPKLSRRDYAAAAVGVETDAWRQAQRVAEANAAGVTRERRNRKATRARARALERDAQALQGQGQGLEREAVQLRIEREQLELLRREIQGEKRAVDAQKQAVFLLEAERDALQRRLEQLEQPREAAPRRGRDNDLGGLDR